MRSTDAPAASRVDERRTSRMARRQARRFLQTDPDEDRVGYGAPVQMRRPANARTADRATTCAGRGGPAVWAMGGVRAQVPPRCGLSWLRRGGAVASTRILRAAQPVGVDYANNPNQHQRD